MQRIEKEALTALIKGVTSLLDFAQSDDVALYIVELTS